MELATPPLNVLSDILFAVALTNFILSSRGKFLKILKTEWMFFLSFLKYASSSSLVSSLERRFPAVWAFEV
jgi:hypothetical protein